ncbi:MAG TPA: hypothetical protein VE988_08270 [Gemmataceae bacterium]|nr:hypothetical protein [Gemmataceae bacterium]
MKATAISPAQALREVLRGERPLNDLNDIGMCFHIEQTADGTRCWVDNPQQITVIASLADLAHGLLALLHDPSALREWALFVNASDVDFDPEGQTAGEALLEAIHDASFGNRIESRVLAEVRGIAK